MVFIVCFFGAALQQNIQEIVVQKLADKCGDYQACSFNDDLERIANTFTDWRYFYEGKNVSVNRDFLEAFWEALKDYPFSKD